MKQHMHSNLNLKCFAIHYKNIFFETCLKTFKNMLKSFKSQKTTRNLIPKYVNIYQTTYN